MAKILQGKVKKNISIRLGHFFQNRIIPEQFSFEELKREVTLAFEKDQVFVAEQEPKDGDVINWPSNSSYKYVLDALLSKNIITSEEEGKLYIDRIYEDKILRLAYILQHKYDITLEQAIEKARRLQGSCHENVDDDYYQISTQEAIRLAINAGGIPILAHPIDVFTKFEGGIIPFLEFCKKELVPLGLKGFEAFYPRQAKYTSLLIQFCEAYGLFITGGSDDHQDGRNHIGEDDAKCPWTFIEKMLASYS